MTTKFNGISDADRELFRNSIGSVQKIRHNRLPVRKPRPAPVPVQRYTDAQTVQKEMATTAMTSNHYRGGDDLFFKRPGIQDKVMAKLRKGKFAIERELDLHGLTGREALTALNQFLLRCRRHDIGSVRIIHGKGRGSPDGKPVIKNKLNQWLQTNNQILAFCSARSRDGGTGAIHVLLKTG